jgi:hypothetical protein
MKSIFNWLFGKHSSSKEPAATVSATAESAPAESETTTAQDDSDKIQEKFIIDVLNKTLPNLAMVVRDINLPEKLAAKYEKKLILLERGYTDASCNIGGMITTHRFAICSNHMKSLADFDENNRGLCVALAGSHFLCLGQYVHNGKTLIILLHLPDDETWQLFQHLSWVNIFDDIITSCVEQFKTQCDTEPIPELTDKDWLDRCSLPIGMDNEGNLFD